MKFNIIILIYTISVTTIGMTIAQETPAKKDSIKLYKSIETYSKRSKFNGFIYQLIFKPVATKTTKKRVAKRLVQKSYRPFEGKIIRHINIETLDPFGYSVADTTKQPMNTIMKAGEQVAYQITGCNHSKPFADPAKPTVRFIAGQRIRTTGAQQELCK